MQCHKIGKINVNGIRQMQHGISHQSIQMFAIKFSLLYGIRHTRCCLLFIESDLCLSAIAEWFVRGTNDKLPEDKRLNY
jgi:hypothetical protein